jgi:hypothetical protein
VMQVLENWPASKRTGDEDGTLRALLNQVLVAAQERVSGRHERVTVRPKLPGSCSLVVLLQLSSIEHQISKRSKFTRYSGHLINSTRAGRCEGRNTSISP